MPAFDTDTYTFNGVGFRFILPSAAVWVSQPLPRAEGEWVHIPYSAVGQGNVYIAGEGSFHVEWSPPGGIVVPALNFAAFFASAGIDFYPLTVPWGTELARLVPESLAGLVPQGSLTSISHYIGSVTWEWA